MCFFFFFKQKTAYEMRISDWSSDVCSSDLWTITFLAFDLLDSRVLFRDYWMDWFFAALAILFYVWSGWLIGQLMGSSVAFAVMAPQLGASVLAFPLVARIVLGLDRWRLSR